MQPYSTALSTVHTIEHFIVCTRAVFSVVVYRNINFEICFRMYGLFPKSRVVAFWMEHTFLRNRSKGNSRKSVDD